jgi:F0F1-type ATP synthase membrane subunit c/vacuolar-type H+-ATPase subunit K
VDVYAMVVAAAFGAHAARERRIPLTGILLAGVVVALALFGLIVARSVNAFT